MAEGGEIQVQANDYKKKGNEFHSEGRYEEAIEQYTIGISEDSSNHILYSNRSASQIRLGNYEAACSDADEAIKLDPTFIKGYYRKGSALQKLGKFEEAKLEFEKGLKMKPSDENLLKGLKECKAALKDHISDEIIANPFANLETVIPILQEDERTRKLVEDPDFMAMLQSLGEDPMNIQEYLKDDHLRLTLSVLLGSDLEHPDNMNLNEPPFVDPPFV